MPFGQPDVDVSPTARRSHAEGRGTSLTEKSAGQCTTSLPQIAANGFLILPENQFGYSVLTSLGSTETGVTSPHVFLYGPAGAGKSHLLRTALQELTTENPTWRTLIITVADFAARFTEAAESKAFRTFRKQFQQLDLLILEDLQAISGRIEPQQQLVAMLDDALAHQCRVVISCHSGAREVGGLIPELVNRCHGAVQVPLRLPSQASRHALLAHWTQSMSLSPDVIPFVSQQFAVSIRELAGLSIQLNSLSQSRRGPLDLDFVKRQLLGQHPKTTLNTAEIAKCVARHFQVTLADLRAKSRQPGLVLPRQCAMFLMRELTPASFKAIGDYFGGRDHTTVLHACQKVQSMLPEQPALRQDLAKIRSQLQVPESVGIEAI